LRGGGIPPPRHPVGVKMGNIKLKPPFALPVASVLLVLFGLLYAKYILVTIPEKQQINNVILIAVPFICYFVAILLVYIFLINIFSQILNHRISPKIYKPLNFLIIAGIIVGILLMLQPFAISLYKVSFMIVLVSLLLFIFWSHVIPANTPEEKEE
jgi:ABC-type transport system involved in cytochrome c biogenesis permease subunit